MSHVTVATRRVFVATRMVPDLMNEVAVKQTRTFFRPQAAYLWKARGALFMRRMHSGICVHEFSENTCRCKYCDPTYWQPVVERLARILRHRDRKAGAA